MRLRLLGPLLLAPAALGLATWLWRRWGYPVQTRQRDVAHAPEPPVESRMEASDQPGMQTEADGEGPRFHRTYTVMVQGATVTPSELMAQIQADIQHFVPDELARFEKVTGDANTLRVGDEFDIHISSPWDGPVRVIDCDASSFTFGTREGHMEAGQIRFRVEPHEAFEGGLRFTIESWARSRDALVDLVYDDLGLAKQAQQAMWTFFCTQVAEASGGEKVGTVEVVTEREEDPS